MEDYFELAGYNEVAKSIMGRAKLEGSAKTWWKIKCKDRNVFESTQRWEAIKEQLHERYLPLNYSTGKMNEFLACVRGERTIETYYEEFIRLSRHAPHLTTDLTLRRFIQGLEGILADEVEALRPISLADALIRAKSKLKSIEKRTSTGNKRKDPPPLETQLFQNQRAYQPQVASFVSPTYQRTRPNRAHSVAAMQEPLGPQCYRFGKRGQIMRECNEPLTEDPPPNRPLGLAHRPRPPPEQVFQTHQTQNFQRGGRGGWNGSGG